MKKIRKIINALLPFLESSAANKQIDILVENLENKEFEQVKTFAELTNDYNLTFQRKDKFEDKAKSNIVSVTIAVTLILGSIPLIKEFLGGNIRIISCLGIILFIFSVLYMIVAGLSAFTAIIEKNIVYTSTLKETDLDEIRQAIEGNNYYNLIRNNLINASYRCIRNSLVCMFLVMLLLIASQFNFSGNGDMNENSKLNVDIFYNANVVKKSWVIDSQSEIEAFIQNNEKVNTLKVGEVIGIVDLDLGVFVKLSKSDNNIINVMLIEDFENN